jgi:hypothetical protein
MKRTCGWLAGAMGLAALGGLARAQDTDAARAAEAVKAADPDEVDPVAVKGDKWTLQFKYEDPAPIVVTTPEGKRAVYWYVLYTVTNDSQEDRLFVPSFTILTDTVKVFKAGICPSVFEAIKAQRKVPFLEDPAAVLGKVRVGPDNAKTSVAIFPPLDPKTDKFTIFVGGLSGEYVERPKPGAKADTPADERVLRLYKALALEYDLPGDESWLNLDKPKFTGKKWTWR